MVHDSLRASASGVRASAGLSLFGRCAMNIIFHALTWDGYVLDLHDIGMLNGVELNYSSNAIRTEAKRVIHVCLPASCAKPSDCSWPSGLRPLRTFADFVLFRTTAP